MISDLTKAEKLLEAVCCTSKELYGLEALTASVMGFYSVLMCLVVVMMEVERLWNSCTL